MCFSSLALLMANVLIGATGSVAAIRVPGLHEALSAGGHAVKVVATDAGSVRDFQAFAKQTGNELVEQQNVGDEFIHVLRRR